MFIIKSRQLLPHLVKISICSRNRRKHANTPCVQSAKCLFEKSYGTYSYHWASSCWAKVVHEHLRLLGCNAVNTSNIKRHFKWDVYSAHADVINTYTMLVSIKMNWIKVAQKGVNGRIRWLRCKNMAFCRRFLISKYQLVKSVPKQVKALYQGKLY